MTFLTLRKHRLCYLASPYSLHVAGQEAACADAAKVAGDLIAEGVKVFSPIAHSHTICENSDLDPLSHDLWLDQDEAFMDVCDALIVALFVGWENSYGIRMERDHFEARKKPIYFLDPIGMQLK